MEPSPFGREGRWWWWCTTTACFPSPTQAAAPPTPLPWHPGPDCGPLGLHTAHPPHPPFVHIHAPPHPPPLPPPPLPQVGTMKLGPVAPFDASALVLVVGGVAIALLWGEGGTRGRGRGKCLLVCVQCICGRGWVGVSCWVERLGRGKLPGWRNTPRAPPTPCIQMHPPLALPLCPSLKGDCSSLHPEPPPLPFSAPSPLGRRELRRHARQPRPGPPVQGSGCGGAGR